MTIKSATPQDTYDHVFGSGATDFPWWLQVRGMNVDLSSIDPVPADWEVEVTCETGDDDPAEKSIVVDHARIMKAARYVIANKGKTFTTPTGGEHRAWGTGLERECTHLVFRVDEADLDAPCADELLQIAVLGEVVFG